jgi:hypothetical protein
MERNKLKNMVVLKNLPSNIVEEAIVILKPHVKLKNINPIENKKNESVVVNKSFNSKDYILNEAQMVISNYVSSLEKPKREIYKIDKKMRNECKKFKLISIVLGILLVLSFLK